MQQRVLNTFRHEYNWVRPHEALDGALPSDLYRASPRPYPRRLEPLVYPAHFEVRRVSKNGGIRWFDQWVNVSHLLGEEYVGLEEIDAGLFDVYFGPVWLGHFVEEHLAHHRFQRPREEKPGAELTRVRGRGVRER